MTTRVLQGDCRDVLKTLPDASVHCVVTSPPYWNLRDYGVAGQLGLEPTPAEYVAAMVEVFREVWRVLRPDGTVWLNLGDTYATRPYGDRHSFDPKYNGRARAAGYPNRGTAHGVKHKDLVGIPWRVAFALQSDGWWLRNDNIWAKRNCMPESTRSRTTRAHEYVFHLVKSGDPLFWTHRDLAGVRERPLPDYRWIDRLADDTEHLTEPNDWRTETMADARKRWRRINLWEGNDTYYDATAIEEDGDIPAGTRAAKGGNVRSQIKEVNGRPPEYFEYTGKRNKRSVWWMTTQPYAEAHFATFPAELPKICIKAGTSERGCCPTCGAPWSRQTKTTFIPQIDVSHTRGVRGAVGQKPMDASNSWEGVPRGSSSVETLGWLPTCSCPPHEPIPCTVLDPFGGAGTVGMVADRLGRDAILIELNSEYCAMVRRRLETDSPLFAQITE